ncbi:MAG: DoxX family protein [Acidobacteria bacterium]|nr:DoxX family protein [Acidobacteriota bacterium]
MFKRLLSTTDDYALTILRLVLGLVFFAHGSQKMLGWFGGYGFHGTMGFFTGAMHIPAAFAFLAIIAEFFGALGLITGLLGRVAAFGIFCVMAVAVAMVHSHVGFFMNWNGVTPPAEGYEYHLLAMAIALAVMIKGSGALSLDRMLAKD